VCRFSTVGYLLAWGGDITDGSCHVKESNQPVALSTAQINNQSSNVDHFQDVRSVCGGGVVSTLD